MLHIFLQFKWWLYVTMIILNNWSKFFMQHNIVFRYAGNHLPYIRETRFFLRWFRDPNRVPRIVNRVPRIRKIIIGSLE